MKNAKTNQNNERLDALAKITTSKDKVIWRKVGAAFSLKNRPGYSRRLEFMPAISECSFEFILVEPNASPIKRTGTNPPKAQRTTASEPSAHNIRVVHPDDLAVRLCQLGLEQFSRW